MTLMLHSGANAVTYDELRAVATPEPTESHVPIPHHEIVELMRYTLGFYQHEIAEEHHATTPDGARYFGIMCLRSPHGDYTDMLGLRNSHDKSLPIGIAFGSRVFVCDNLAFAADHVIRRKHTVKAKRELPALLSDIIVPLKEQRQAQNTRLLAYKEAMLDEAQVDHAIMSMYRKDVIGVQAIGQVLKAYDEPPHDWGDRSAWRLFNAATFALAGRVAEKPAITRDLHQVIDGVCHAMH
ncbi:uncharacterized protein DUF932 [Bradyrhizobium sp. R2.2-H]|jgi:hypothetical protein|uniref:DUF932 domain-containing protein n=1 Tax=unclassified Bradyrhizobium TaxID=2631580 RepID=UPI001045ABB2|nr:MULTISPECIES: DUF932 domain-containing protein [unclassified Bradyrhizobium]TCU78880.1 uncharacterized protein DUF932 [Bradyrhizobium sp. Y-H1]TCU80963.1 uncharacterized protein DUF932 [Bradyrhizobium sp. R2.2-H]